MSRHDGARGAPQPDARDPDDLERLADEAREQRIRMAREIRAATPPRATEPAATYRP